MGDDGMKYSDLDLVNKLHNTRQNVKSALDDLDAYVENQEDSIDQTYTGPCPEIFQGGYWGHLSMHGDGSGSPVPLGGCYVGIAAANAVREVLETQLANIDTALRELGVDI
jgi:hypothetical protein